MIEHDDPSDDEMWVWVREHIADMEAGTYGQFFAPEGGPSAVNEVRGDEIANDYLSDRGWHLREEWAADVEEWVRARRGVYDLRWWDDPELPECPSCGARHNVTACREEGGTCDCCQSIEEDK